MLETQYCGMLVQVVWIGCIDRRGHQGFDARVAFGNCKGMILQTRDVSMRSMVGNE
jgi:hypothetical protein